MLEEKYYTVADVAQVTGLTSRTIRNYLKDGTLTGQKIGVQWRFTEEEIRKLFSKQTPGGNTPSQLVRGFLGNQDSEQNICLTLMDFPHVDEKKGMSLYCEMKAFADNDELISEITYEYHEDLQLLRVAVTGETGAVTDFLEQSRELFSQMV